MTTVYETADTIIRDSSITMKIESVLPVVVNDVEFPAESFANLMMCNDNSIADPIMELEFHLSDYHREHITIPMSQLKRIVAIWGVTFTLLTMAFVMGNIVE